MPASTAPSIVVSGCGWVTPVAVGTIDEVFAAARRSAGRPPAEGEYWPVDDQLLAGRTELKGELRRAKGAAMTAVALQVACQTASLPADSLDGERTGLVLGCALAGQSGMIGFAAEVHAVHHVAEAELRLRVGEAELPEEIEAEEVYEGAHPSVKGLAIAKTMCERNDVDYIVGMSKNERLKLELAELMCDAEYLHVSDGGTESVRLHKFFDYSAGSWHGVERKVIGNLNCSQSNNPMRFEAERHRVL